jgi:release factor glutamine methyltransferase
MTIAAAILEATRILRLAGVSDGRRDAGVLMAHTLGRDRTFIISHAENSISADEQNIFLALIERRAAGEPIQYLTGHQEFFKLDFIVSKSVLIPRPETELLVECALELFPNTTSPIYICDVGTGSGCIAISFLHERPTARGVALDLSEQALHVAIQNAQRHKVAGRLDFLVADGLNAIRPGAHFDLVLSNPPYVADEAFAGLQREVREHEPKIALSPGGDGLRVIRSLIAEADSVLKPHGCLLIEIGFDQRERVTSLIESSRWELLDIHQDLQGIPRTVALRKRKAT